jgi:hypothetical protein
MLLKSKDNVIMILFKKFKIYFKVRKFYHYYHFIIQIMNFIVGAGIGLYHAELAFCRDSLISLWRGNTSLSTKVK